MVTKAVSNDNRTSEEKMGHAMLPTVLVERTLRSGQSIHFHGNIVILGDVNPGAEVIAAGNIVVMGSLRGVAHAGVSGNEQATVTAYRLQPTQLRIANQITRAPDENYGQPVLPETAKIKDGIVVIEQYQFSSDRVGNLL